MEPTYTIWEFAKSVDKWYEITQKSCISYPDMTHSALLRRILAKAPIYKLAPPKAFSYPWYELLDSGVATSVHVNAPWSEKVSADWKRGAKWKTDAARLVTINQTVWALESEISDNELIASFPYYKLRIRCVRDIEIADIKLWTATIIENENVVMK